MNDNNNNNSYNNNNVWIGGNPITLPLGAWVGNTSQGNSRETPTGLQQPQQLLAFLISIINVAGRERQCTAISHYQAPRTGQCTITNGVISVSTGKPVGITALEHFSLKGEQPQEQALRAALGCKMNCKQLLLLCLLYKCLSDETWAIMEGCSEVPASWLSLAWLTALPVTSLFQWTGPTLVLADPHWSFICWRMHPEEVLSVPTFQWWQHYSAMSIHPLEKW